MGRLTTERVMPISAPLRAASPLALAMQLLATMPAEAAPSPSPVALAARRYLWKRRFGGYQSLSTRIAPPAGYQRVPPQPGSFAAWLRELPLLPAGSPVRAFDGRVLRDGNDPGVAAVVDLDLSRRDRQQCADSVMRLRGEYLQASGRADKASFPWAGGKRFGYKQWREGLRPVQKGRSWAFEAKARPSSGHESFRAYLEFMFTWTGTQHLVSEPRVAADKLQPGDFFIQAGSPGHAVIALDLVRDAAGRRRALIGQGFMPAQDLHVLRAGDGSAWFELSPPRPVQTPFWRPFAWSELRRFR